MKPIVMLLTFGPNEGIFAESLLCIASWLRYKQNSEFSLCIFTDRPDYYKIPSLGTDVTIIALTNEQIEEWRKPTGYFFRPKLMCIAHATKKFNEPILFVDSDTVLMSNPEPLWNHLAKDGLWMHKNEGLLKHKANPIMRKIFNFVVREQPSYPGLKEKPANLAMWNSGVLGFSPSQFSWVELVITVCDDLYRRYPKHLMEQFAFSWVFQERGDLKPAESWVWHYWFYKAFREELLPHVDSMRKAENPENLWKVAEPLYSKLLQKTGPDPKAPFLSRLWKRFKNLF